MTPSEPALKNVLTASDVCSIIEASARSGVRELKFAGLEISFEGKTPSLPSPYETFTMPPTAAAKIPVTEMTATNHEKQAQESLELDELELREQQIEDLLLTDPLAAEQMIRDGELLDERAADDEA